MNETFNERYILTGLSEQVNDIQASIYLDNEVTPYVIRSSIRSIANYLRLLRNIPDPVQQIDDNDQKKDNYYDLNYNSKTKLSIIFAFAYIKITL